MKYIALVIFAITIAIIVTGCAPKYTPAPTLVDCPDPAPQLITKVPPQLEPVPPLGDDAQHALEVATDALAKDSEQYNLVAGRFNDLIDHGFENDCW